MKKKIKFTQFFLGLSLLSFEEKRITLIFGIAIIITGMIETIAFGSVIPLITFILEPKKIEENIYYQDLLLFVGEPSRTFMTFLLGFVSLVLLFVANILSITVNHFLSKFTASCWRRVANELMKKSIDTPYEWFLSKNSSIVTRLFHHDIPMWSRDSIGLIITLFSDFIIFIFISLMVILVFPIQGIWAILIAFLLGLSLVILCRPKIKKYADLSRKSADETMLSTSQIFSGIKDIKISSNLEFFRTYFDKTVSDASHAYVWTRFWSKLYPLIFILIVQMSLVLIAISLWASGLSGSEIAVFMALAMMVSSRIIPSINRIMGSTGALINIHPFIVGIINFKNTLDEANKLIPVVMSKHKNRSFKSWKSIKFEEIFFKYQNTKKNIIKNLNFQFDRGLSYGIVGESGSGKTTIIDLLLGLLFCNSGKIEIDNVNLNYSNINSWIKEVGYVQQAPYLIDATLKENIAFSLDPNSIDEKKIKRCISMSQLDELVKQLPLGENTQIGERGSKLSGGQKQRIAIARALYKNPSLLILDEATNALDSQNEEKIISLIKSLNDKLTTILVTHKISNLKNSDQIIILKNGVIAKIGNYKSLKRFRN